VKDKTMLIVFSILGAGLLIGGGLALSKYFDYKNEREKILLEDNYRNAQLQAEKDKVERANSAKQREIDQRSNCQTQAATRAQDLLKEKADLSRKMGEPNLQWEAAIKKELYLKDDYENYLSDCLKKYGLY
jgi:hypothetical protein